MGELWSRWFPRSAIAPSVFTATRLAADTLTAWLGALPDDVSARHSDVFSPLTDAWAFGGGGATYFDRYGFGSMPSGYRVVGWSALRLLITEFDLRPPTRPLLGETAHRPVPAAPTAGALAAYHDAGSLRWVVRRALGDSALAAQRDSADPAVGAWGDAGFTELAAARLADRMAPERAVSLARRARLQVLADLRPEEAYGGIYAWQAEALLTLDAMGDAEIER